MVQQQAGSTSPPQLPVPPLWYWTARGMAEERNKTARSITNGVDKSVDEVKQHLDTMQDALGLNAAPPAVRIMFYYNKPDTWQDALALVQAGKIKAPYSWESQLAYFPRDYEEDWADFQKLRERARNGEFGPMIQAQEIAYTEPQIPTPPVGGIEPGTPPAGSGLYTGPPEPNVQLAQPPSDNMQAPLR